MQASTVTVALLLSATPAGAGSHELRSIDLPYAQLGPGEVWTTPPSPGLDQNSEHIGRPRAKRKLLPNGLNDSVAWIRHYDGPANRSGDHGNDIAVGSDNSVYVTGYGHSGNECVVLKYGPRGKRAWLRRVNGIPNNHDTCYAIAVDANDNVYAVGHTGGLRRAQNFLIVKFSSDGTLRWKKILSGEALGGWHNSSAFAVATGPDGAVHVAGRSGAKPERNSGYDFATAKLSSAGEVLWVGRYAGFSGVRRGDEPRAIAVNHYGEVFVTGDSPRNDQNLDYATVAYDRNGRRLWTKRRGGAGNDDANAIAVDQDGNVYVTGDSPRKRGDSDFLTLKYDRRTGRVIWSRRLDGPSKSGDGGFAIGIDSTGAVIVTGATHAGFHFDFMTVKYRSNGRKEWVRTFDRRSELAFDLAVDKDDNIATTGGHGVGGDYVTVVYSPDGDELLAQTHDGRNRNTDTAFAVAFDSKGAILVTGATGAGGRRSDDITTIKYKKP